MRRPASLIAIIAGLAALAWTACVQVPADRRDPATFPGTQDRHPFPPAATTGNLVPDHPDQAGDPFRLPWFALDDPTHPIGATTATGAR